MEGFNYREIKKAQDRHVSLQQFRTNYDQKNVGGSGTTVDGKRNSINLEKKSFHHSILAI